MIAGEVTPSREAVIPIELLQPGGASVEAEAVIDTGFTEFLTVPPELVVSLGLPFQTSMSMEFGDGRVGIMAVHEAMILWHGDELTVPVHVADAAPLVGMALLSGSRVSLEVIDGGAVIIDRLT